MSKYVGAVGLASNVVQLLDFARKLLLEGHSVYQSADSPRWRHHAVLQHVVDNIYRLTSRIREIDLRKLSVDAKSAKLDEAAQLLKIGNESIELANSLIDALRQAQAKGQIGEPRWATVREALFTVWKKKDVTYLQQKLGALRKEVDAALLLTLRKQLDQSAELFSIVDPRTHLWERWQTEAIDAIHQYDWKPKTKGNVEEFSKVVGLLIDAESKAHFCSEIFARLHFPEQDDRLHSICAPHEDTFEWIFHTRYENEDGFLDWLGNTKGHNLFWLTGKPGCGKSTLMKLLFRNPRIFPRLEDWSGHSPGILTGYFLWNCGTNLQKSSLGLLRALLYEALQDLIYGPLEQSPSIIQELFADRWKEFVSYGGGLNDFTFPELRRCFELLVSDTSKMFLFMIDGLDELEESPTNLIDLVLSAVKRENVKICVSSSPSLVFQQTFEGRPSLMLDQWTRRGVLSYVLYEFDQNDTMFSIPSEQSDGSEERAIIKTIVRKASGSYLWASLATEFLLQSTTDQDDVPTIRRRVDALPPDLNALLAHILDELDPRDLEQASRLFRLVNAHGYPGLLPLCFASELDPKSSFGAPQQPLKTSDLISKVEVLRSTFKFKCKNILLMFEVVLPSDQPQDTTDLHHFKVNYAHRCLRDFFQSDDICRRMYQATGNESFDTDKHWANASLWMLKTRSVDEEKVLVWEHIGDCVEYALRLETTDKKVRLTYLDEVASFISTRKNVIPSMDFPPGATVESFLDIAVWLNLSGYVTIKVKSADRKEIRHAMEYAKEMRLRLGVGGEERWLRGRSRLSGVYTTERTDLDALLEYYTKAVRLGTLKPAFEVPEFV